VKGNKELTFIMILPLHMFDIRYKNYLVRISTTKRVLTGFLTKIKIKKITERIKNISELFSEIMGCANLFQNFLTSAVYCVSTPSILLTRVHACAQMKLHKHMRDMRDLLRFKAYFQFNITINSNELSVLVLFSRSRDFIPGITFKDVLRLEERNRNVFF
jgi:hypothetical protein